MNQKIRAAVAVDNSHTEVREFDVPQIPVDGGLLKIELTGVCGSDALYYRSYPKLRGPLIFGHGSVGHVSHMGASAGEWWGV